MLSSKIEKTEDKPKPFWLLSLLLVDCYVGCLVGWLVSWGFFLMFKCCFNSGLFLKLHAPNDISELSAGMHFFVPSTLLSYLQLFLLP